MMNTFAKLVVILAIMATALSQPAFAQETVSPMVPPKAPRQMPDDVKSAWACVAGGAAGTTAALLAGAENLVNVIAGGIVAPANRSVMAIGLAGVVFTTFCTLGQQLLPLAQYYWGGDDTMPAYPESNVAASVNRRLQDFSAAELPPAR